MTSEDKAAALVSLYRRITHVAEEMGGRAFSAAEHKGFPAAMVAEPRTEEVPALHVEMPNGLHVDFTPTYPLSVGNVLRVDGRRTLHGAGVDSWFCILQPDGGWRGPDGLPTDDAIRQCLKHQGPPTL